MAAGEKTLNQFVEEFAGNAVERFERLESHAEKVDKFLFKGEPGKPALAAIVYSIHQHFEVWSQYARVAGKVTGFLARTLKKVAIILGSIIAIAAAVATISHFFGFGHALAQSIKEHGSFSDYVRSVIQSREFAHFWVLVGFGMVGVMANWFWKWATDQITGSLWKYLVQDYPKRSLAAVCCIIGWALWAVDPKLSWSATINLALATGFAVDVMVNKATRAQWTEEERVAKKG